jgi:hypothetical protein
MKEPVLPEVSVDPSSLMGAINRRGALMEHHVPFIWPIDIV